MSVILAALRERYPPPEWALFAEVANGTGGDARRRADAVVMNLYPSRGLAIHGFEIKEARGDWIREMKDAAKADVIASKCDYWWLVAGSLHVVKDGELPHGWGLLVLRDGKLRQMTSATSRERESDDIPRPFVAALLRRAAEASASQAEIDAAVAKVVAERNAAHERALRMRGGDGSEVARLKEVIAEFERVSGVHLSSYNAGHVGDVVRYLSSIGGRAGLAKVLAAMREQTARLARETAEAYAAVDAAEVAVTEPKS